MFLSIAVIIFTDALNCSIFGLWSHFKLVTNPFNTILTVLNNFSAIYCDKIFQAYLVRFLSQTWNWSFL